MSHWRSQRTLTKFEAAPDPQFQGDAEKTREGLGASEKVSSCTFVPRGTTPQSQFENHVRGGVEMSSFYVSCICPEQCKIPHAPMGDLGTSVTVVHRVPSSR